jgi:hypothetical protein
VFIVSDAVEAKGRVKDAPIVTKPVSRALLRSAVDQAMQRAGTPSMAENE